MSHGCAGGRWAFKGANGEGDKSYGDNVAYMDNILYMIFSVVYVLTYLLLFFHII